MHHLQQPVCIPSSFYWMIVTIRRRTFTSIEKQRPQISVCRYIAEANLETAILPYVFARAGSLQKLLRLKLHKINFSL